MDIVRRRSLERDEDKCSVIAELVDACAAASGAAVDAQTTREVVGRLEAGFADRVVSLVEQLEGGWQRRRFDAAMRHRPVQESVLDAAFRALVTAEVTPEERIGIARQLDAELGAAAPAIIETLRMQRYDEELRELVPRSSADDQSARPSGR
jgi:hypothetical protein